MIARAAALTLALAASAASAPWVGAQTPPAHAPEAGPPRIAGERLGRSLLERPIGAVALGPPKAARTALVVGCVHGDECAGRAVTDRLVARAQALPTGTRLIVVRNLNPDGFARATRGNARGVDLNRNAREGWRRLGVPGSRFYSGTGPFSEPESTAIRALLLRERPDVVVWYHQPLRLVDVPESGSAALAARYARAVGLPLRRLPAYPGSLSRWTNARVRSGSSFVVEFAPGRLTPATAERHARAVRGLLRLGIYSRGSQA